MFYLTSKFHVNRIIIFGFMEGGLLKPPQAQELQKSPGRIRLNKANIKATWKMIDMITSRNKKKKLILTNLLYNSKCYTDKAKICDKLNEYFLNVGPSLASKLPTDPNLLEPSNYIKRNFQQSFMFRAICTEEVSNLIQGLKTSKASIGPAIKCIKLANQHY